MKFITLRPEFRPANEDSPHKHQHKEPLQQPNGSSHHHSPKQPPTPMVTSVSKQANNDQYHPMPNNSMTNSPNIPPPRSQNHQRPTHQAQTNLTTPLQAPSHRPTPDYPDSPRLQMSHQQHNHQQQTLPTPPQVPQHRQAPVPVDRMQQRPNQPSLNNHTNRSANMSENCHNNYHDYTSPPNQYHFRTQSQPMTRQAGPVQQMSPLVFGQDGNKSYNQDQSDAAVLTSQSQAPPLHQRQHLSVSHQSSLDRQSSSLQSLNTHQVNNIGNAESQQMMPPPRPPPRRRQSTASLFKPSPTKPIEKTSREMHDPARKSIAGRVREHANRFNTSASTNDLTTSTPKRNSSMKENRLSRDSATFGSFSSALQRNGSHLTTRSRSSHRGEDESDSSSLQPIDTLRRRWAIEACNCNHNNLLALLREDPKLAPCKDIINGYTALHWAAKFGNTDIIKLIAGTYGVSANIKSGAGHTPLHVAYMFNRLEIVNLLLDSYQANSDIRDHSGKKPMQYWQKPHVNSN